MYNIDLTLSLTIAGCPDNGLAAIDFRTSAGITPEPSREIKMRLLSCPADKSVHGATYIVVADPEAVCRAMPALLTSSADMLDWSARKGFDQKRESRPYWIAGPSGTTDYQSGGDYAGAVPHRLPIPASAIAAGLSGTSYGVIALLTAIQEATAKMLADAPEWEAHWGAVAAAEQAEKDKATAEIEARRTATRGDEIVALARAGKLYTQSNRGIQVLKF